MVFTSLLAALGLAAGANAEIPSALAGTWILSHTEELKADGTRIQNYGPNARGLLLVDNSGRYSLQIFRKDRPHFISNDKLHGTPEEYRAAVTGISTHIGEIEAHPKERILVFKIEAAAFPNWEGTQQKRRYKLVGDTLSYEVPPTADGTIARSVWRKCGPAQP